MAEEAIDDAIKVLQGQFQVKDPMSLEDYLGVQIVQSDDGKKAWLGQPTIFKSLEKQFGNRSLPLWTLLAVLWQMCHVWITYGKVRSSTITMRKSSGG